MVRPQVADDPLALENAPKVEFIDTASNKPVDPKRFQVFEVPKAFLEWVLSKEPPHLEPDDFKDTAPRGLHVDRSKLVPPTETAPEPEFEATPVSTHHQPRRSAAAASSSPPATVEIKSDDANATVAMRRSRRQTSLFTYWALTGRVPRRIKLGVAAILGILILILAWKHVDMRVGSAGPLEQVHSSVNSAVRLIAPPSVPEKLPALATPVTATEASSSSNALKPETKSKPHQNMRHNEAKIPSAQLEKNHSLPNTGTTLSPDSNSASPTPNSSETTKPRKTFVVKPQ